MSKRSAKLPRSSSFGHRLSDEAGSAVVEFALIAVPLCLVFAAAMTYCLNVYVDSTMRFEAIAAARFAALADVTASEANVGAFDKCSGVPAPFAARCTTTWQTGGSVAVSEFSYQPLGLLTLQPKRVVIHASAPLEISK